MVPSPPPTALPLGPGRFCSLDEAIGMPPGSHLAFRQKASLGPSDQDQSVSNLAAGLLILTPPRLFQCALVKERVPGEIPQLAAQ